MTEHVRLEMRNDGIGMVIFDRRDSSANVFDHDTLKALEECIVALE